MSDAESEETNVVRGNFPQRKNESLRQPPVYRLTQFIDDKDYVGKLIAELVELEVSAWFSLPDIEQQLRLGQYIETVKLIGVYFSIPPSESNNLQRFEDIVWYHDQFSADSRFLDIVISAKINRIFKDQIKLKKTTKETHGND